MACGIPKPASAQDVHELGDVVTRGLDALLEEGEQVGRHRLVEGPPGVRDDERPRLDRGLGVVRVFAMALTRRGDPAEGHQPWRRVDQYGDLVAP